MRPPNNLWPNTPRSRGTLFVAQLFREMLSNSSFESFRGICLDSATRLREGISLCIAVNKSYVSTRTIAPTTEEIKWSLENDPAVESLFPDIKGYIKRVNIDKLDPLETYQFWTMLNKRIEPIYKAKLEDIIVESAYSVSNWKTTSVAAHLYLAHMINIGYEKQYIFQQVNKTFFDKDHIHVDARQLRKCFRNFTLERNKYYVYILVQEALKNYLISLDFEAYLGANLNLITKSLNLVQGDRLYNHVIKIKVSAFDPYAAAKVAQKQLNDIRSATMLAPKSISFSWLPRIFVMKVASKRGDVIFAEQLDLSQRIVPVISGRQLKTLTRGVANYLTGFNSASKMRLFNSLSICATARSLPSSENKLVAIWSAFEVLFRPPSSGVVRILHYEKLAVPIICLKHAKRLFVAVYDELQVSYRSHFRKIVNMVSSDSDLSAHNKFIYLILCDDNNPARIELNNMLISNPLGMHRINRMRHEYSNPKSFRANLEQHEQKVRWQLFRINRVRNEIVHAGETPTYLDGLVLNALEYYRSVVGTIIGRAKYESYQSDIDQIIAEIDFDYFEYKNQVNFIDVHMPSYILDLTKMIR